MAKLWQNAAGDVAWGVWLSHSATLDRVKALFSLSSNNNNNSDKTDNETEDSNESSGGEAKEDFSVKSSSIADLRMKAKRHQEALGINDSD